MITFRVNYRQLERDVTLYHEWDIEDKNDIIDFNAERGKVYTYRETRDKFFKFTDGSDLYVKIKSATFKAIVTEIGVVKIRDYCSFCIIRYPYTNYSGVRSPEEHPLSRPYRRSEHLICGNFISRGKTISKMTPRIVKMLRDKLKEMSESRNIDADWFIDKIMAEANNPKSRGAERLEAIRMLGRMQGVELDKGSVPAINMSNPLFNFNTPSIQDRRRNMLDESKEIHIDLKKIGIVDTNEQLLEAEIAPDTNYDKRIKILKGHVK